ncbi:MAG TPA: CsgG/HfaB family protein [candidate division Zixibacteria bacterium]|nr:CsgG/HfaB family protein [candidate division Zixibacteria bacterium]
MRVCKTLLMLVVIGLVSVGSALADAGDNLTYQGNKARITVGTIKDKAKNFSDQEAAAIGEMLSTALSQNPKFIVLASQEEVAELADEIEFAQSGYAEEGRGPEKGLMESADILITGAVTDFKPDAGGGGGGLGGLTKKAMGAVGVSKKDAQINMDIKIIDIRTRRVLKSMSLKGKATSWKATGAGASWSKDLVVGGALSAYSNEPMGDAIREVLGEAVEEIADEIPNEYYRYQGQGQYTTEYASGGSTPASGGAAPSGSAGGSSGGGSAPASAPAPKPAAEDMTLYTKYDFVPGDKVIFFDDLIDDEEGDFPYRWDLKKGVYEVARFKGQKWILCTNSGEICPRLPDGHLPETYTIEMDFYVEAIEGQRNYYYMNWLDDKDRHVGQFMVDGSGHTDLSISGSTLANKKVDPNLGEGVHTMRVMVSQRAMKCFLDQERVANVPRTDGFNPTKICLSLTTYSRDGKSPCIVRNYRFAEGGKTLRQQLDETGKIVTHGILFDSDSHVIKKESYKTLKNIGELLSEDAGLRLSIEGHTDSDGSDDHNLELSRQRAESVRNYLVANYGIAADRLESKGWGESKPIDGNTSPEGKANNRRVELIKL